MSDGIWSALSGAVGQLTSLDVAANNVANAGTPGFRKDHAVFREHLSRAVGAREPGAARHLRYATVDGVAPNALPGNVVPTGRPLDVAIRGDGLLVVRTERGERYTRQGSLAIGPGGALVTKEGDRVLDPDRRPIRIPPEATEVHFASDGTLHADGEPVGRVLLVSFPRGAPLTREGALLYRSLGATPSVSTATLEPAALEESNANVVESMVSIVGASRGFEACERAIDAFRDADRRAAMSIMGKE